MTDPTWTSWEDIERSSDDGMGLLHRRIFFEAIFRLDA